MKSPRGMAWRRALVLVLVALLRLEAGYGIPSPSRPRRSIDLSVPSGRPQDARLPEGLRPTHYHVTLRPFLEEGRFEGKVRINMTCEVSTRAIHLHAHDVLNIAHDDVRVWHLGEDDSSSLDEDEVLGRQQLSVASTKKDTIKQHYVIFMTNNFTEGDYYEVELSFTGPLNQERSEAFFTGSYEVHRTKERRPFAATQMRPSNARRVFPCFDGPQYKATFDISVVRPARMAALSNMPVRSTDKLQNEPGWEMDHFQTTPLMSTFSVAVVVSDLGYITPLNPLTRPRGPRIRVFGRAHFLSRLQEAADAVPSAITYFEDFFDVPFPLPELDLVVLPNYAARTPADMWGLVIFREDDLVGESMQVQLTTELAYQWLGHLCTPVPRWGEQHINKALINFMLLSRLQGQSQIFSPGNIATRDHSLYYEYAKRHPYAAVKSQKETIRVMKTQWVLKMLNYSLSEKTFKNGVRRFMRDRQYTVFEETELFNAMTKQAWHDGVLPQDVQLQDVMNTWVHRDRYPALTATRNYNDRSVEVEQHVFLRERPHSTIDKSLLWFVPVMVLKQSDLDLANLGTSKWMKEQRHVTIAEMPEQNEFIIINPNEIGMFMVNYDLPNWNMLAQYLRTSPSNVDVGTRVKLLHDAWNLAYAGELAFGAALNMTTFLPFETEFAVWDTFFTMVDHVGRHISGTPAGDKFQAYVCHLVAPLYSTLQAKPNAREEVDKSDPEASLRSLSKYILCTAGCQPCREQAMNEFARWMQMDDPEIGNPVADIYLCPVFMWGSTEEFEFGLQRVVNFPESREPEERSMLIAKVAGCVRDAQRVERILNASVLEPANNFTEADIRQIFNVLAGNAFGYNGLFKFLVENWDAIRARCEGKPGMWEFLVSRAISNFKTQDGLDLVSELYVSRMGHFGTAEPLVEEALKTIKEEAEWSSENLPDIERWLDNHLSQ